MFIYIILSLLFLSFYFFRQLRYLPFWIFVSSLFILCLSFRSQPDEYFRYLQNSVSSSVELLSLSILSEPLYQGFCLLLKNIFSPFVTHKLLYIISYILPFFSFYILAKNASYSINCRIMALNLTTFYYLSHPLLFFVI